MRRLKQMACVFGLAGLMSSAQALAEFAGDVNFIGGARELLDDEVWGVVGVDRQIPLGVEAHFGRTGVPIFAEVGLQASFDKKDSSVEATGLVGEIYAGVLLAPLHGQRFNPYIGLGYTQILAYVERFNTDDEDSSGGLYIHAGINFEPAPNFILGLDFRFVRETDLTVFRTNTDADYQQLALTAGYRWGGPKAVKASAAAPQIAAVTPAPSAAPKIDSASAAAPVAPAAVPKALVPGAARVEVVSALRYAPKRDAAVERALVPGTAIELSVRKSNAEGAWWYATALGATGWVHEAHVTQQPSQ